MGSPHWGCVIGAIDKVVRSRSDWQWRQWPRRNKDIATTKLSGNIYWHPNRMGSSQLDACVGRPRSRSEHLEAMNTILTSSHLSITGMCAYNKDTVTTVCARLYLTQWNQQTFGFVRSAFHGDNFDWQSPSRRGVFSLTHSLTLSPFAITIADCKKALKCKFMKIGYYCTQAEEIMLGKTCSID